MNCPTCSTPMKPLFSGEFCPNDCDRTSAKVKEESWKDQLLKRIRPNSAKLILKSGWLECPKWALTFEPPYTYRFFPDQVIPTNFMYRATWIVRIENGKLYVAKNRSGGVGDISEIPVHPAYEEEL